MGFLFGLADLFAGRSSARSSVWHNPVSGWSIIHLKESHLALTSAAMRRIIVLLILASATTGAAASTQGTIVPDEFRLRPASVMAGIPNGLILLHAKSGWKRWEDSGFHLRPAPEAIVDESILTCFNSRPPRCYIDAWIKSSVPQRTLADLIALKPFEFSSYIVNVPRLRPAGSLQESASAIHTSVWLFPHPD